jgi:chromosome partitioning protein
MDMTPDQATASRSPTAPTIPQQSATDKDRAAAAAPFAPADPSATDLPNTTDPPTAGATGTRPDDPDGRAGPTVGTEAGTATNPDSVEAWSGTGSGGSGAGRADPSPETGMASEGSVTDSPQDPGAGVGWFSPGAGGDQYAGPLSERLSAERPGDGPLSPAVAQTGPGSDVHGAAGPAAAATNDLGADTGSSAGQAASLDATPGSAVPADPGEVPIGMASAGTGLPPASRDLRSPELIESGMVYVDPDPEIGSPPHAVGWAEEPVARQGPDGDPGDPSDASREAGAHDSTDGESGATGAADTEAGAGPDAPAAAAGIAGSEESTRAEPSSGVEVVEVGPGVEPASEPVARGATGSVDAGEVSPASAPDEAPWNEPALPMAWPPGVTPPDRGERSGSLHDDADDGDLIPEPDPTWPKLFGQSSEPREADGTGRAVQTDDLSSGQRQEGGDPAGSPDALRSSAEPATGQPTDGVTPPDQQPAVVDITSQEPSVVPGSKESLEPDHVRSEGSEPGARTDTGNESGTETSGHANISTVVQQAKTEEGEVGLRETPANPRSIDVSRETSAGGGGGMDPGLENESLEDEAAVAVREAVSRAAAEAGVDVSRETEPLSSDFSIDQLGDGSSIDRESAARNARVTFRIDRDALNGDRRVMAVANQKGGVGKSTTAVNIGAYLALAGARVLVVDLDPQGNASTGLGLDHRDIEPSIYDVLTGEAAPVAAIRPTGVANLHVLPSTIDLAGAEVELVSAMSRETRLRRALESIDHQYDSILIDCPPSLGLLTVNALAAADELLIPIQCEYYALEGLGQLLRNVELVRANLNPDLRIGGIVLTMYDGRTRLALQVVDEVRKHFTDVVFQTVVPRSVRLSEAPGYGLPIALYDPLSRGGIAYRDLTFELAERSGLLAPTGEGAS